MRWSTSAGPAARNRSVSRSRFGRPPTTLRPSRRRAAIVCGPHTPSGTRPTSRWNRASAAADAPAEDAVGPAEVVPELEQSFLQLPDVVAEQRLGLFVGEHPRSERPPGGVDRAPGLVVDLAVDGEPAGLLEGPYRPFDRRVVDRVGLRRLGVVEQPQRGEDGPDLHDRVAAVTAPDHLHRSLPPARVERRATSPNVAEPTPPDRQRPRCRASSASSASGSRAVRRDRSRLESAGRRSRRQRPVGRIGRRDRSVRHASRAVDRRRCGPIGARARSSAAGRSRWRGRAIPVRWTTR